MEYSRKTRMLRVLLCMLLAHLLRIPISSMSLKQPNISLISEEEGGASCLPNPQRSEGTVRPQTLEVTKGHNFSIVCSSEPQGYTGGSFRLLLSGSNQTWREPAQDHSAQHHLACFLFHEANDFHQGNYSCVFEVTVGSRHFNSTPSELLTVTVKVSWLLYLLAAGGLVLLLLLLLSIFLVWRCCLGNRRKKASLSEARYAGNPEGGVTYWRNEPVEDDERDYESADDEDDEDKEDYVNTETLGVKAESLQEEEDYVNTETLGSREQSLAEEGDYVNTETLGSREQSLAEEGDYVNTETLGGGVEDYERMDNYTEHSDGEDYEHMAHHSGHSDGEDYVNVDPLSAGINI
ncbi:uncharacterized protein LOC121685223 [Alosa sapidissima]|uniref:uncharacterized protein LOC121685223 n=1 Tax=Alosa sapidissima TaxID=34773 RepID=UPI001C0A4F91|nr:uncharacterized protein LOC121685223 [Alosa sapidissima]